MKIWKRQGADYYLLYDPQSNFYDLYDVKVTTKYIEALSELHGSGQSLLKAIVSAHLSREVENAYKAFVRDLIALNEQEAFHDL